MSTDSQLLRSEEYELAEEDKLEASTFSSREFIFRRLTTAFSPLYRTLFSEDSPTVQTVRERLDRAAISMTVEDYMSGAMALGALVGILMSILGAVAGAIIVSESIITLGIFPEGSLIALFGGMLVVSLVGTVLGVGLGIGAAYRYLRYRANKRRREIDRNLTDAIVFMYSLSAGGMSILEITHEVAQSKDAYGELATEFRRLVREMDLFNQDYRTALQTVAEQSPSSELEDFFYEMATNVSSGGDITSFLGSKKDESIRQHRRAREEELDRLDGFNEVFLVFSIVPILLIISVVALSLMGTSLVGLIPVVIYAGMPLTGVLFLVLASSITSDRRKQGRIESDRAIASTQGIFAAPIVDEDLETATETGQTLERARYRAVVNRILERRTALLRENPLVTLVVTVPLSVIVLGGLALTGTVSYSASGFASSPLQTTVLGVFVPALIVVLPLTWYYEKQERHRRQVIGPLRSTLRKLKQANEGDNTLLQAISIVGRDDESVIAEEFREIEAQVSNGSDLQTEMIVFANKYRQPRLSRTVKLINRAREASSDISDVLSTAAELAEVEEEMRKERVSRSKMQVAIVVMTFIILTAILLILKVSFLTQLSRVSEAAGASGGAGADMFSSINVDFVKAMFLHGILMQGVIAGSIAGYMMSGKLRNGLKYVIGMTAFGLVAWYLTGMIF